MADPHIEVATFKKKFAPKGWRVTVHNIGTISDFEDCHIMRDKDGHPLGVEVQTTEGSLDIGMNEGWIFEDSDGEHYPISNEAVQAMYKVKVVHTRSPF